MAPPCTFGSNPGSAVNSGSSASARLIFTVPLRVFQWVMSFTKSAGSSVAFSWSRNVILGWHVGDDDRRDQLLAAVEHHAASPAVLGLDRRDAGVHADLGAEEPRRLLARGAHRAHAALGIAP